MIDQPLASHTPTTPRAPATPAVQRSAQVYGDELEPARSWSRALAGEGVAARAAVWDDAALEPATDSAERAHAWIVHLTRALPPQLARLRQLRSRAPTQPLLVVCQGLRDLDQVLALEMGADDVVDAAMPAPVVAARLRALWRRGAAAETTAAEPPVEQLRFGALALHWRDRRALLHGQAVALSDGEFDVLWLLALRAGHAVSRVELVRTLRGLEYQRLDRSIDCRVYRIRLKLDDRDPARQRIRTVRNRGYLFVPSPW